MRQIITKKDLEAKALKYTTISVTPPLDVPKIDDYKDKLLKLIPTEIIAAYVAIDRYIINFDANIFKENI